MDFSTWNVFWSVTFTLMATVITAGNLVTIVIFIKQKFLERTRFLLLSLAMADTFVGTLSVPLYIAVGIRPQDNLLVLVFRCVDVFTGMVSIFTLASISLERMHAIVWPFRHRALKSCFYPCAIGLPWLFGLLGVSSRLLHHLKVISPADAFSYVKHISLDTSTVNNHLLHFDMEKKTSWTSEPNSGRQSKQQTG